MLRLSLSMIFVVHEERTAETKASGAWFASDAAWPKDRPGWCGALFGLRA